MKTKEFFCGTKSFSTVMSSHGYETFTVDIDEDFNPDLCSDVLTLSDDIAFGDIVWFSPPCQGFSVAAIGRNWNYDRTPKTDSARLSMALAQKTLRMIEVSKPTWWFIENPRGMLRKMPWMDEFMQKHEGIRHTITYCQYGDTRQKPTDIWTNASWWKPTPVCSPGSSCHESAPRGSRTGTQGLKYEKDRSRIPAALFEEILRQYELSTS